MVCHSSDTGHRLGSIEADSSPAGSSDADGVLVVATVVATVLVQALVVPAQAAQPAEVAE